MLRMEDVYRGLGDAEADVTQLVWNKKDPEKVVVLQGEDLCAWLRECLRNNLRPLMDDLLQKYPDHWFWDNISMCSGAETAEEQREAGVDHLLEQLLWRTPGTTAELHRMLREEEAEVEVHGVGGPLRRSPKARMEAIATFLNIQPLPVPVPNFCDATLEITDFSAAVATPGVVPEMAHASATSGVAVQEDEAGGNARPEAEKAPHGDSADACAAELSGSPQAPAQETHVKRTHTSDEPAGKKAKASEDMAPLVLLRPLLAEGFTTAACVPPAVEEEHACGALSKADVLQVLKAGPKQGMSAPVLMTALSVGRSPPSIPALRDCLVQLMEGCDVVRSPLEAKLCSMKDDKTLFRTWDVV